MELKKKDSKTKKGEQRYSSLEKTMKIIILILIIAALKEIYEKNKTIKQYQLERDILINEISEERYRYNKEKNTIEYFFSILNGTFSKESCTAEIEYLQDKENFYFITREEICKYRFLLREIEYKKLLECFGIIKYNNKLYYLIKKDLNINSKLIKSLLKKYISKGEKYNGKEH